MYQQALNIHSVQVMVISNSKYVQQDFDYILMVTTPPLRDLILFL